MRLNFVLLALAALPSVFGAVNGRCSSGNGVCVTTQSCTNAGGTYKSGLCPNDPNNVKCCNKPKCVTSDGQVGSCMFTSSCTGKTYSGLCPGGSNFKCCVNGPVGGGGGNTATGTKIVNYAKQFIGNPYVYGGNSLTNGIDCSGFTQQILGHFGISIPRVSADQATKGKNVNGLANARAGDLVFYCTNGKVTHVAIYEGSNGKIVHAANSRDGIKESNANYQTPCRIRRFI